MASIEERKGATKTTYRVIWYDNEGRKRAKRWATRDRAELWKNLIEAVDGDTIRAANALARQASTARTVDQVAKHRLGLIRVTPYTRQTYEAYMRNHISEAMGDWPIDTVAEDDCRRFIMGLEENGLSAKYVRNIAGWLSSIMIHASERGWRDGNPVKPEMLPRVQRSDADETNMFLTREEAYAIIERMRAAYQLPALLMLATGLRPSEMRALTVGDVYLDAAQPVVRVTKAVKQDVKRGEYVGPPKSAQAVRSLGLPGSMVPLLVEHIEGRGSGEFLFPGATGGWMSMSAFSQAFRLALAAARREGKLGKDPSPYSLRHTHATMMIDKGMDIYKLSRHMGHASVQMTEKVYLHLYPDAVFQAAEIAGLAIGDLPQIGG